MKKIQSILTSLALVLGIGSSSLLLTQPAVAVCQGARNCITQGTGQVNSGNSTDLPRFVRNIINILLFIIGVAAVVMIIIGGFRYVVSQGDQGAITSAKNTILYSVIGLIVAALAFAIVNFIVINI